jgi:hypothetical protein
MPPQKPVDLGGILMEVNFVDVKAPKATKIPQAATSALGGAKAAVAMK